MRIYTKGLLFVIVCTTAFAGCAKKEMVRSGETAPSVQSSYDRAVRAGDDGGIKGSETLTDAAVREDRGDDPSGSLTTLTPLETVYFDFDSYLLTGEAREVLNRNADWLKANPKTKVQIEGHCDERGSDAYNLALGERRARSAFQYLQHLGIGTDRIYVVSFGEEKPAIDGSDESAWSKNRRAALIPQR